MKTVPGPNCQAIGSTSVCTSFDACRALAEMAGGGTCERSGNVYILDYSKTGQTNGGSQGNGAIALPNPISIAPSIPDFA
jgi:hypothetical protein